jgi:inner membrane protein
MASVGHVAVGMLAARLSSAERAAVPTWRSMAWWSALSLMPDADVIGFSLGVEYGDPWGHRGATHSLAFALAAGAFVGLGARRFRASPLRFWAIASAVLVSHGLLDTITDGGLGCALFWPFDLTRYFAPWRPIPVAPIGLSFFSPYGLIVSLTELVLFAPIAAFALRLLRARMVWLPLWAVGVWLIVSTDPLRERVVTMLLRDDTEFASGFTERSFMSVREGDSVASVDARLGAPLGEILYYLTPGACRFVNLESNAVVARALGQPDAAPCRTRGIHVGMTRDAVVRALGPPDGTCAIYSRSPSHRYFRGRGVCFEGGKVIEIHRMWTRME